jgi:hypothetical protein
MSRLPALHACCTAAAAPRRLLARLADGEPGACQADKAKAKLAR